MPRFSSTLNQEFCAKAYRKTCLAKMNQINVILSAKNAKTVLKSQQDLVLEQNKRKRRRKQTRAVVNNKSVKSGGGGIHAILNMGIFGVIMSGNS